MTLTRHWGNVIHFHALQLANKEMRHLSAWIQSSDLNVSDLVIETWQTAFCSLCLSCSH